MKGKILFWWRWLVVVTVVVLIFGICMVLAPALIQQCFGLLMYSSAQAITAFGPPSVAYIALLHGILGAVMFGWGIALMFVLYGPFRRGAPEGWRTLAISITAWFVPDTLFSLATGFGRNAIFNLVFAAIFAVPLAVTYRTFHERRG